MPLADRSDAELIEQSQAGVAPAFAVLLHRHGPAVRSAVRQDPDPTGAVIEVFIRAMRGLPDHTPTDPVRPWLLELSATGQAGDPVVPLSEEERDEIWAELALRWPTGKLPHRRRREALQRVALVVGLMAISALVPVLVLLAGQRAPDPVDELRAFPLQTAVDAAEPDEPEPLPTFTFPTVDELEEPAATADPSPAPTPTPTATASPGTTDRPTPEPTSEPTSAPTREPVPAPTGEPTEGPIDGPTDDPTEPGPSPTNPDPPDDEAADGTEA